MGQWQPCKGPSAPGMLNNLPLASMRSRSGNISVGEMLRSRSGMRKRGRQTAPRRSAPAPIGHTDPPQIMIRMDVYNVCHGALRLPDISGLENGKKIFFTPSRPLPPVPRPWREPLPPPSSPNTSCWWDGVGEVFRRDCSSLSHSSSPSLISLPLHRLRRCWWD